MEESKEIQQIYKIFRSTIYMLLILEFVVFVPFPFIKQGSIVYLIISKIARLGIYDNLIYSRAAILLMTCITCIGTKAKKDIEFDPERQVVFPLIGGFIITGISIWIYGWLIDWNLFSLPANFFFYMFLSIIATLTIHIALDNISKAIKHGLMKDRMNWENESFEQETKKIVNKDSINIPTLFYWKGKMRKGWINIEQPYRGIWVVGVPGSGKTFSIIEPLIRQESAKGWSMAVYDYKFPTLARKLFYQFEKNKILGKLPQHSTFNVINFVDVEYSRRVNPIQNRYINSVGEASETAVTLMEALQKGGKSGGGGADDFFKKAAENFLAACIFFFVNYDIRPYDKDWNLLTEKKRKITVDGKEKEETYYVNKAGVETPLYREKGRYADLPHVLSFLQEEYTTIFNVLMTDEKIASLIAPFQTALKNKAMDQLEGMVGTLRIYVSRLITPEAYWVLSGDDFDLKISDPANPSYLLIANDPKMEAIITALNAVILNRLVSEVNTGEGKNNPVSIIVDELPTLYFNKIDRLQGTARSNKVAIALGFQSKEQLEKDYGKEVAGALLNIFGTVVCAASCGKDTVEWLSNDIFGKIKQIKEGVSVTRDQTTLSLNEELQPLVPPDKIANIPAGWLCGMTARSFRPLKTGIGGKIDIQKSDEFKHSKFFAKTNFDMQAIENEEKKYKDIPKFYDFGNDREKKEILINNYRRIVREVRDVCEEVLAPVEDFD
jgi:hypothetical protein